MLYVFLPTGPERYTLKTMLKAIILREKNDKQRKACKTTEHAESLLHYRAYDLGYEIVGTDCIPAALKDFLENKAKVKYTEEKIDSIDGTLFKVSTLRNTSLVLLTLIYSNILHGLCSLNLKMYEDQL